MPDDPPAYWPDGHDKAETLGAFVKVYATVGFIHDGMTIQRLRSALRKSDLCRCRWRPDTRGEAIGRWIVDQQAWSWEDIQHKTLKAMEDDGLGLGYGKVAVILRRPY